MIVAILNIVLVDMRREAIHDLPKRLLDVSAAFVGILVLLFASLSIAVWIKFDSGGPVFYRDLRAERHGKEFRIFKFRTMVVNAESIGGASTPDDDGRLTGCGRFKLGELPQLINVLKGEMSWGGGEYIKAHDDMIEVAACREQTLRSHSAVYEGM